VIEAMKTREQSTDSKEEMIVKKDESDGDLMAIGFGGKSLRF
jgi:hypothetical protein